MLNVKIEIFKPYRKTVQTLSFNDREVSENPIEKIRQLVDNIVRVNIDSWLQRYEPFTEVRWEFVEHGQGHYIPVVHEMWLTFTQMIDVLHKAIELNDWQMVEDIGYQLKLMASNGNERSLKLFTLPAAKYEFDWTVVNR